MKTSRRNVIYTLGSLGISAAVPVLSGCRRQIASAGTQPAAAQPKPKRDPNVVRVLLEGPWILRAASNSSDAMQAIFALDMAHTCLFGQWVGGEFVGTAGTATSKPSEATGSQQWIVSLPAAAQAGVFQNVVTACSNSKGVLLNDKGKGYTAKAKPGVDFTVDLPAPTAAYFGLPYATSRVKAGGASFTPFITVVLHYPAPLAMHTGAPGSGGGFGDVVFAGGSDVILRMTHHEDGSADNACKHIFEMIGANDKRVVANDGTHPGITHAFTDTTVDTTTIDGDIDGAELGDDGSGKVYDCTVPPQPGLKIDTLANCLGGNVVVGDGN